MGSGRSCCKSAWSASRWGWLSIFFTSSRTRKFSACFTTACDDPETLKSMSIFSRCVNKPTHCSLWKGRSPFLHDMRPRFFLHGCFRNQIRHVCRFLEHSKRVRGSFSAKGSTSSFARVRKVIVHHMKKKVKTRKIKKKMKEKMESNEQKGRSKKTSWTHEDDTCVKCATHTFS